MLVYSDDLELVFENESDLKMMIECFDLACRKRSLKVNAGKSKKEKS